jgi:lysine N6-hydroxylase
MPVPAAPTSPAPAAADAVAATARPTGTSAATAFGGTLVGDRVQHVNCLGVGVGPANLSLASLLVSRGGLSGVFVERRAGFGWHDGQQVPDAALQVSMLKDLVSLADPTSPFTFLAYLHDQGRIYQYLNAQFDAVPRMEFRNYLAWAADRNPNVVFGEEVESIDFDGVFRVRTSKRLLTADHVSVGVGNQAWLPPVAQPYLDRGSVFHVSQFNARATCAAVAGKRVTVVGGGQSGAEAFLDLINRSEDQLPRRVSWVSRRANFFPIDDSPFTNDYYMPDHSDYFASLPPAVRHTFNTQHLLTSDGISEATLRQIYQRIYTHHYIHHRPDLIALYPNRNLATLSSNPSGAGYELALTHGHQPDLMEHLDTDVIVFATGFRPHPLDFLQPLNDKLRIEDGEYHIDTHYAATWNTATPVGDHHLFLQNATKNQRGLADPNLSLLAWRSQRILDRLTNTHTTPQHPSFIEWSTKQPSVEEARGGSDEY